MTDKPDEEKDKDKNPFDQLQEQLQELFKSANISVMPGSDLFGARASSPAPGGGDEAGESEDEKREEILNRIRGFHLKPRDVKDFLDRFVIKQDEAKKAMAVAMCDHYNHVRRCLEAPARQEKPYAKQNVILLGPTGVGKTYLMRTLARLIGVPFVKADATKFSETGYVGYDVEDIVRDLVKVADGDAEVAQYGIIYIDEIDKIASQATQGSKDVSGRGVQVNLLKLMEESEVNLVGQTDMMGQMQAMMEMQRSGKTRKKSINTRHMLFIVSGAFTPMADIVKRRMNANAIGFGSARRPGEMDDSQLLKHVVTRDFVDFGFEPEFIGRLPVRVAFDSLEVEDLLKILEQAEDNILCKYMEDFQGYGIDVDFAPEALRAVAERAKSEGTGARGLMTVLENALRPFKFELPSTVVNRLHVDAAMVAHPQEALDRILEENLDATYEVQMREVQAFVERFREQHGLSLVVQDDAAKRIASMAAERGKTVYTVCERQFRDLPYALKLIAQHSGRETFDLTRAMVENPDQELSRLVTESYRKPG